MVTEIALIDVLSGKEQAFVDAYREARKILIGTPGCLSARMVRGVETPTRFVGVVEWESREHHLENFRGTDRYTRYGGLLGPYVAVPPVVEHFNDVE
jgi:heme-degrading monooxygenase HmoA